MCIKDPIFRTKRVWHDFDYPDVEKMSSEEVRERLREERARSEARASKLRSDRDAVGRAHLNL